MPGASQETHTLLARALKQGRMGVGSSRLGRDKELQGLVGASVSPTGPTCQLRISLSESSSLE